MGPTSASIVKAAGVVLAKAFRKILSHAVESRRKAPRARNAKAWGNAPGHVKKRNPSAEGAEYNSIPNVSLVVINCVSFEELAVFVLKRDALMVLLLTADVSLE